MRRAVLIVNPFATNVDEQAIERVEAELARVADVATLRTERPRHATDLVEDALREGGCDAIVVFSGDGGFNEVINGLDADVPVGFLPGGGTSVLPRALGLPRDPVEAARHVAGALEAGRMRRISVGRVNGRRFAFSAGIGLDAEAVRRMDARGRDEDGRRPGDLAFAATIAKMLIEHGGRFQPCLEVKGLGRAAFALVSNGDPFTYAGGRPLHIAPDAEFELGLDVTAPVRIRKRSIPRLVRYVFSGRTHPPELLQAHDLDRIEIACDAPMPLEADGEDLGDVEEALFEAERGALTVLV